MEVEEMNFGTHMIIIVQLYYWLSENASVKIWSNKFQIIMINYSELCASSYENLMSEFYVDNENVTFYQCQSKSFTSMFFTCQVSACELQPFSCQNCQNCVQQP